VPVNYVDAHPRRVREIVNMGFGGITRGLHRIMKPTIAAVNGWALAGGLELALACDLRVASERAMFGSFEVRRGFHHGDGGISRMVNTCGVGVAMQMVLTAEPIDALRALQCNMVTKVVPHDELMQQAELLARQILRNSQRAVRSAKETIFEVLGKPLDDQLRIEPEDFSICDWHPRVGEDPVASETFVSDKGSPSMAHTIAKAAATASGAVGSIQQLPNVIKPPASTLRTLTDARWISHGVVDEKHCQVNHHGRRRVCRCRSCPLGQAPCDHGT
jgi:hypothetical protein